MTKYRALQDVPPNIKQGDIVDFKDPLVEGYKKLFEKADADAELTFDEDGQRREVKADETVETINNGGFIANPDRNALKARATELGVNFAQNVSTDKLVELVKEAEDKKAAEDAAKDAE